MTSKREERVMDENADFTMEELVEFLEGDFLDVQADPAFKERLRRKLWEMTRARVRRVHGDD